MKTGTACTLTTMGRDDPLYVWFGHTSLVVEDTRSGREVMYDFGIISFEEGFYRAFALGRMWYLTWATDAKMRIAMASSDQRDISTVELNTASESHSRGSEAPEHGNR